jgi:uncharacterized protein YdbL (DUF1318 family)
MQKTTTLLLASVSLFFSLSAAALDLQQARSTGQIGELNTGYVQALQNNGDATALADDVNAKRRAEYSRISAANGQSVDIVAKLAAGQIVKNLGTGAKYQDTNGSWQTR